MTMSFVAPTTARKVPPPGSVLTKDESRGWRVVSVSRPRASDRKISLPYVELLELRPVLAEGERRTRG